MSKFISVLDAAKLVKLIKSSYIVIIFQHALENLFQVADLKEQNQSYNLDPRSNQEKEVKKKKKPRHLGHSRLPWGILSYPAVSQITLRRQFSPLSSLILPSHVSLNQEGSLLMRAQENSSDDKDDTSLDIKIHMRPQGNKALCFSSAKHNDI